MVYSPAEFPRALVQITCFVWYSKDIQFNIIEDTQKRVNIHIWESGNCTFFGIFVIKKNQRLVDYQKQYLCIFIIIIIVIF